MVHIFLAVHYSAEVICFLELTVVGTVVSATLGGAVQLNLRTVVGFPQGEQGVTFMRIKLIFKTIPCVVLISEVDVAMD